MKRSRVLYFHEETNEGKLLALEALHLEYKRYLQTCISTMLAHRRSNVPRGEILRFFPSEKVLSTNLVMACQQHAVEIVKTWSAVIYQRKLKSCIKDLFRDGQITEAQRFQLFTIGKYSVSKPTEAISQDAIDLYWKLLLDPEIVGRTPTISDRIGMRMSIHTSTLRQLYTTKLSSWWLGISTLTKRQTIKIPLKANPHVTSPNDVVNGCLIRKDRRGRWRAEVLEKKLVDEPKFDPKARLIGVDVGLNVLAATSDGRLLGAGVKPKFDALYTKVRDLRANRQRQGLRENSPRLDRLEERLSGLVKTATGTVANDLVKAYPGAVFVVEDLDLRGCRGQKRFAYRALHTSLDKKAFCLTVNPAYTSQMCPSCGYVSRKNRKGTEFKCRGCGRISHADVVGGVNLLGRSENKEVGLDDHPSVVKALLRERYRACRRDSSSEESCDALAASSRRLTTRGSKDTGIASNAEGIQREDG